MANTNTYLSVEQFANLFTQLKRMESSGLSCVQAMSIIYRTESDLKKPLFAMIQQLNLGQPVSEAGFKAGIFNETLKTLIRSGESSGKLGDVYGQLANYYTGLDSRIKRVKSRLIFPVLTLILAMFIQPLPAFITGDINLAVYLQHSLGRLAVVGLGGIFLLKLPRILRVLGVEAVWHRLQLKIPGVGLWVIRRQVNEFFFMLAMMLEGGLTFSEALPQAVEGIKNTRLQEEFIPALELLDSGVSVTNALAEVSVITPTQLQIVSSSELSGKLASGILHFTQIEAENISLQDDALADWLPRIIYSVIAAWMAYTVLTSPIATVVPPDI